MPLDTTTLASIGLAVASQIKGEILDGVREAAGNLSDLDRKAIVAAVEQVSYLAAAQYAGQDVSADLAQWRAVIVQYQDVVALIAKRVTRERLAAIGQEVAAAALKVGEAILRGLIPI